VQAFPDYNIYRYFEDVFEEDKSKVEKAAAKNTLNVTSGGESVAVKKERDGGRRVRKL
jgi:hypothetical protein